MTTGATGQLGLALPVQGELSGTWGDTVNNGLTQYINIAIAGTLTLTNDGAVTLANTTGDASASNVTSTLTGAGTVTAQFAIVRVTGTLTVAKVVTGPSYSKTYTVVNAATGGIVTFKAAGQTGVSVAVGETAFVYFNGTDYVKVVGTATAGAAGGSTTQVQYNNAGVLAGITGATTNGTALTLVAPNLGSPASVGTMPAFTLGGTVSGGGNQINNVIIGTTTPLAGAFTTVTASTAIGTTSGGTGLGGATPFTSGGVVYASSSSALATGSALTFDGTNLAIGASPTFYGAQVATAGSISITGGNYLKLWNTGGTGVGSISSPSTDTLSFGIGSSFTEAMRLTSSSLYTASGINVGIGAISAGSKLDVVRSSTATGAFDEPVMRAINTGAATLNQRVDIALRWQDGTYNGIGGISMVRESATARSGSLVFLPIDSGGNGLAAMQLNSSGNLGLGVTPSAWSAYKAIQTTGASFIGYSDGASNNQAMVVANAFYDSGANWKYIYTDNASRYQQLDGQHIWYNAPSGTAGNTISFTQAMTLDASGRLGIGTSSPVATLSVSASGASGYEFFTGPIFGATGVYLQTYNRSSSAYIPLQFNAASYNFGISGAEQVTITSAGNVGIGISTPTSQLELNRTGTDNYSAIRFSNSGASGRSYEIGLGGSTAAAGYANNLYFYDSTAGLNRMTLNTSGNLGLGVTPSAWLTSGGTRALQFAGGSVWSYATDRIAIIQNAYLDSSGNYSYIATDAASHYRLASGVHAWFNAPSGTAGNAISFTQAMTLDASGNLLLGTTSTITSGKQTTSFNGNSFNGLVLSESADTANASFIIFNNGSSTIGSVYRVGSTSAVVYATTSDYRLKTVVGAVTGHGERLDALEPIEYEWKSNGSRSRGFLAHKFQEVYAQSVTGDKDAMDADGNPKYQSMQAGSSEVIADLVAEIKSLRQRLSAANL
jgi:hypothetical protein